MVLLHSVHGALHIQRRNNSVKAEDIRKWLDQQTNPGDEVWIDGSNLVIEGSNYVLDCLEIGLMPDYDKEWRDQ